MNDSKAISSRITFVFILAVFVGIVAGIIGASTNTEPTDGEKASQQLDATIAALSAGKDAPVLMWPQSWPAAHPILFGGAIALGVFLVGLLIIIAINTSRRPA